MHDPIFGPLSSETQRRSLCEIQDLGYGELIPILTERDLTGTRSGTTSKSINVLDLIDCAVRILLRIYAC